MKNILSLFFLFFSYSISAQSSLPISFEGILGAKLNVLKYHGSEAYTGSGFVVTSPMLGFKINHKKYPFSLSFIHDRSIFFRHYPVNDLYNIQEINRGNIVRIQYEAKRFRYGLGHYWYDQENAGDFLFFDLASQNRFIALMFAVPFGQAEIEFQSLINYKLFDLGDRYHQELNFKYHFGGQKNKIQKYATKIFSLNFLLGGRFFSPDQPYLTGERKVNIGITPTIGAEILFNKYKVGVYWEKDWWLALNGGSPTREVKGQINTTVFGLKYHHSLKNNKSLNIGIGYAGISDASTLSETARKISKDQLSEQLYYANIRGISIAPSFDFNKNFRVEVRQIIATQGEKGIDLERLSLGMFYKIWP